MSRVSDHDSLNNTHCGATIPQSDRPNDASSAAVATATSGRDRLGGARNDTSSAATMPPNTYRAIEERDSVFWGVGRRKRTTTNP